jgi:hypothetical protein
LERIGVAPANLIGRDVDRGGQIGALGVQNTAIEDAGIRGVRGGLSSTDEGVGEVMAPFGLIDTDAELFDAVIRIDIAANDDNALITVGNVIGVEAVMLFFAIFLDFKFLCFGVEGVVQNIFFNPRNGTFVGGAEDVREHQPNQ